MLNKAMKESLLLHCCCGPCASASVERLIEQKELPLLYYSNSNILSLEEFQKREDSLATVARQFKVNLKVDPWDRDSWEKAVAGMETEPEGGGRCRLCFRYNLGRTASMAENMGLPFSTTLTISPLKNSRIIFEEGRKLGSFEEHNFKKKDGYKRSIELSREWGLYRQDLCGCRFSTRD